MNDADIVVPLRSRRRERALLVQKLQHGAAGVVLLGTGLATLGRQPHGFELALGVREVGTSALVLGAIVRAMRRVRHGTRGPHGHAHSPGVDWIDVFVAGVLGAVLATEGRKQWPVGLLVFALAALWDLLFLLDSINTLPATVPIAAALIIVEVRPWLSTRRRPGTSSVS